MPPTLINSVTKNRLLAALPREDLDRLHSHLHRVSLSQRQVLYEPGATIDHVYFVEQGVASVLTSMANGATIEVGIIGTEGMVGVSALLGAESSAQLVIVQIPGTALRMDAACCKAAFDQNAAVRALALRFTDALLNLSSQTAACNRLHSIEQRCARWLLMASDRIGSATMPMTDGFLSSMLGVRRAGSAPPPRSSSVRVDPVPSRPGYDHRPRRSRMGRVRVLRVRPRPFASAAL